MLSTIRSISHARQAQLADRPATYLKPPDGADRAELHALIDEMVSGGRLSPASELAAMCVVPTLPGWPTGMQIHLTRQLQQREQHEQHEQREQFLFGSPSLDGMAVPRVAVWQEATEQPLGGASPAGRDSNSQNSGPCRPCIFTALRDGLDRHPTGWLTLGQLLQTTRLARPPRPASINQILEQLLRAQVAACLSRLASQQEASLPILAGSHARIDAPALPATYPHLRAALLRPLSPGWANPLSRHALPDQVTSGVRDDAVDSPLGPLPKHARLDESPALHALLHLARTATSHTAHLPDAGATAATVSGSAITPGAVAPTQAVSLPCAHPVPPLTVEQILAGTWHVVHTPTVCDLVLKSGHWPDERFTVTLLSAGPRHQELSCHQYGPPASPERIRLFQDEETGLFWVDMKICRKRLARVRSNLSGKNLFFDCLQANFTAPELRHRHSKANIPLKSDAKTTTRIAVQLLRDATAAAFQAAEGPAPARQTASPRRDPTLVSIPATGEAAATTAALAPPSMPVPSDGAPGAPGDQCTTRPKLNSPPLTPTGITSFGPNRP